MARAGIPEGYLFAHGKDGLTEFIEDIPTRNVAFQLRQLRHDNPQQGWTRTELGDIGALVVALPYCDVMVTEKRWVHLAHRAGLDDKYGTRMLSDLVQLVDVLLDATKAA